MADLTASSNQDLSLSGDIPTLDPKSSRWKLDPSLILNFQYTDTKHVN